MLLKDLKKLKGRERVTPDKAFFVLYPAWRQLESDGGSNQIASLGRSPSQEKGSFCYTPVQGSGNPAPKNRMALVDFPKEKGGFTTRRNVGEYLQHDAKTLLKISPNQVRHSMRWGRGLSEILDAVDQDPLSLSFVSHGGRCKSNLRLSASQVLQKKVKLRHHVSTHLAALWKGCRCSQTSWPAKKERQKEAELPSQL